MEFLIKCPLVGTGYIFWK